MQVNQNVNAANFLLVSSQAGNAVSAPEDTMDFASILQNTSNNRTYQNSINHYSQTQVTSSVSQKSDAVKTADDALSKQDVKTGESNTTKNPEDAQKTTETSATTASRETADTEKTQAECAEETSDADSAKLANETGDVAKVTTELEELSEEDMATILEAIGNLLQSVMEQFDLSLEEFTAKLEEFGMEPSDLLTQDGLKEFFLQMNGAEVSDLIVDENLNMELQTFLGEMSDELKALDSVLLDVESFVANHDVKQLLEDGFSFTEEDVVMSEMTPETSDEVDVREEPEVIVLDNKASNEPSTNGKMSSADSKQQSGDSQQHASLKESAVIDNTTSKQNTFENPILQAIQNAVNNVEGMIVSEEPVQQNDVVRQIVEQVRLNMNQQTTSLELQLYPEHLGRIQINVVSKEGIMTASIVAETEAAKQAIEAGLLNLKEAMEQQNLKVEAIEVMVSTMGFEKGDEQQDSMNENHTSNTRRKVDLSDLGEESPVEDEAELERMKATGSSVSYTA